jgi:hypothetical protein
MAAPLSAARLFRTRCCFPRSSPPVTETPPATEAQLINSAKLFPLRFVRRLIREFDLPVSLRALERIWREHGLLKKRQKTYQRKQCLATSATTQGGGQRRLASRIGEGMLQRNCYLSASLLWRARNR